MADNVLDGVAIIENQKVIYVNNRLCEITGYPHEELFELDSFEIIALEMHKGIKGIMATMKKLNSLKKESTGLSGKMEKEELFIIVTLI